MAICNNKKCSIGECDQPETCTAYVPVITNADRIRAMSDEELAENMSDWQCWCGGLDPKDWLEWLQKPAE